MKIKITLVLLFSSFLINAQKDAKRSGNLEGPENVEHQIEKRNHQKTLFEGPQSLQTYTQWKKDLKKKHGLSFGASAIMLYQNANNTTGSDCNALGGVYRFMGSWELVGRGTGHTGRLDIRVENRSNFSGFLAPSQLSGQVGMVPLNSGFAYSHNFKTDLAVFSWVQMFGNNSGGFAVGRLAFDVYLDPTAFQTFSRSFVNRAFILNASAPTTGIGALGAVVKGYVSEKIWLGGQIYDANAASGSFDFETVKMNEWMRAFEVGFTPSRDRQKQDKIQLSYWFKDARFAAGIPKGQGLLFSTTYGVNPKLLTFFKFGTNDGGGGVAAKNTLSTGVEYKPQAYHAFAFAAGWAEPTAVLADKDEYAVELSYTAYLMRWISVMADFQFLKNPTSNPSEDSAFVFGFRTIVNL